MSHARGNFVDFAAKRSANLVDKARPTNGISGRERRLKSVGCQD